MSWMEFHDIIDAIFVLYTKYVSLYKSILLKLFFKIKSSFKNLWNF